MSVASVFWLVIMLFASVIVAHCWRSGVRWLCWTIRCGAGELVKKESPEGAALLELGPGCTVALEPPAVHSAAASAAAADGKHAEQPVSPLPHSHPSAGHSRDCVRRPPAVRGAARHQGGSGWLST